VDKRDAETVEEVVATVNPDAVVDTAAFHAVDDCETERDTAYQVNATGTRNVAAAANGVGAHYLYLSTDYVFAGDAEDAPYTENDPVAPLNYYGGTKYAGEQAAKVAETWTVLRPSVIYGVERANFVTWVLGELAEGNEVGIVDDQVSTPTYAADLGQACVDILQKGHTGLYHAAGPSSLSRYEFTVELAKAYGYDADLVEPITTEELGQEAPRPTDSALDSSHLYDRLGRTFRPPNEAFDEMRSSD
jgi:dTDP-4-dehydrorhamnose reductase